jgi:hypothetical protein
MISQSRLQEFGFIDPEKFPRQLTHHVVSLSLPSAINSGMAPIEITVENGLMVPLQNTGSSSGMIIQHDGQMLYIGHQQVNDPSSPLESHFTRDIPYDMRVDVSNIMRRAVQADPALTDMWTAITSIWKAWFPVMEEQSSIQPAGEYHSIAQTWNKLSDLMSQMLTQAAKDPVNLDRIRVKVIIQSSSEFKKGWQGEEFTADETSLKAIVHQGRVEYLMQSLFPKLQQILKNPVFSPRSSFMIFYGSRRAYMIKIIVHSPEVHEASFMSNAGIELSLKDVDGFSPSIG